MSIYLISFFNDVTIINAVIYLIDKPGRAQAQDKIIGPYFEGHLSDIILRCSISDPGNPKAKFSWFKDGMVRQK